MDRLRYYLILIVAPTISGTLMIIVMTLGWYSWAAIGGSMVLGLLLTWPVSHLVSRLLKRQDPGWDETRIDRVHGIIPDPSKPEV